MNDYLKILTALECSSAKGLSRTDYQPRFGAPGCLLWHVYGRHEGSLSYCDIDFYEHAAQYLGVSAATLIEAEAANSDTKQFKGEDPAGDAERLLYMKDWLRERAT